MYDSLVPTAWETLCEAGVPDGPLRPPPCHLDPPTLCSAVAEIAADLGRLEPRRRDPLRAWLRGFRHHWPQRFAEILGPAGEACLDQMPEPDDANRYLKLRRIAIANLAGVL
jgi:hypothetical protein